MNRQEKKNKFYLHIIYLNYFKLFIYLSIYQYLFFSHAVWHVGSYFTNKGSKLCPLHWKCRVLTTGLPEESQVTLVYRNTILFFYIGV